MRIDPAAEGSTVPAPESGDAGQAEPSVPLSAFKKLESKYKALKGVPSREEFLDDMQLAHALTGTVPGAAAPPPPAVSPERPPATPLAPPAAAAHPYDFGNVDPETPINAGEVRQIVDHYVQQALAGVEQSVSGRYAEYEQTIGDLNRQVTDLSGAAEFGSDWTMIKQMASEVLTANPALARHIQANPIVERPVDAIALLAARHPKYREQLKDAGATAVVDNIKKNLDAVPTTMSVQTPSVVKGFDLYKDQLRKGASSLEVMRTLDDVLERGG
ncbi:MAG: hypothetical protein QM472_06630 [Spirochaetota bacterium]|nr:hypothetical protein [Spirochaetota bacterium]HPV99215.1 hypothetical protein [Spirochaetota bacterium]